jgi:hypothetical protein
MGVGRWKMGLRSSFERQLFKVSQAFSIATIYNGYICNQIKLYFLISLSKLIIEKLQ